MRPRSSPRSEGMPARMPGDPAPPGGRRAAVWRFVRGALGDTAYEQYLAHQRERHPGEAPLSRREFFRREIERRWSGVARCC